MKGKNPNKLIHATSPYLLQHAYNPVDWHEWGSEALDKAVLENKPILVSIGYSACHWCHVMERESFESEEVARIMNANFVCIKVDREERPDVDQVYMEAVQVMGVNGGWPLNVFLNPKRQPFYGGTYFPRQQWINLLGQINQAFQQKRTDIDQSAAAITEHLNTSDLQRFAKHGDSENFKREDLDKMVAVIESRFDKVWGGLEKAPKFVMPTIWLFLLRYHAMTKKNEPLQWVTQTLTRMTEAGLYDQMGGGFARYSVDREWFAPHFEKMLYDNAQLLSLYAEAYSVTRDPLFKTVVEDTVDWLVTEMTDASGGFYSALDADSEGVEGKFYTWTWAEMESALSQDALPFGNYFGFTPEGNWEHGRNILNRSQKDFATRPIKELARMKEIRNSRIRPGLDDKILAGWNAMTIVGLTDVYRVFGEPNYLRLAETNIRFLEAEMISGGKLHRSFRKNQSPTEGFLEDYAFLIQAYTSLYQCTFDERYLAEADRWCIYVCENFFDEAEGYFHFTGRHAETLIVRKKEVFDNVIPGSNSVMARNLFRLGTLLEKSKWKDIALTMVARLQTTIVSEPAYLSNWGVLLAEIVHGLAEVAIVGPESEEKRKLLASKFLPFALLLGTAGRSGLPLLADRTSNDRRTLIHVCFDKACQLPVESVDDAVAQLQ